MSLMLFLLCLQLKESHREKQQNISFSFYLFSHKVQELHRGAADIWA